MPIAPQQLVILHHHLNSGGVTRVVQNHLMSLAAVPNAALPERIVLLHGGRAVGWPPKELCGPLPYTVESIAVAGLDYSDAPASDELAAAIQTALANCDCMPEATLLHWHNHSLGKNTSTPLAVRKLAEQGYRTLLQIHDFAEDFRPENYSKLVSSVAESHIENLPAYLYPQTAHIHYATLNERDHQILSDAGVANTHLHLLPNPVAASPGTVDAREARQTVRAALSVPDDSKLLTYPVRGIRRKNLGELLLWSAVAEHAFFHVSLAPESPAERAPFDSWSALAQELNLPCRLGRPPRCEHTFEQLLTASDALVTTSVAEGFGMVFLEAWLVGKRLLGRNLPEISADFCAAGLNLSELYSEILIPTDWLDAEQCLKCFGEVVGKLYQEYGLTPPTADDLKVAFDSPTIDFARLPIAIQQAVIRRVHSQASDRERLLKLNPQLQLVFDKDDELITANAEVVRESYSLPALGQRLSEVYASVWQSTPGSRISPPTRGEAVLHSFLQIDRLHPVRVES